MAKTENGDKKESEVKQAETRNTIFSLCVGAEASYETVEAWFNNKMTVLLMHMEYFRPHAERAMMKTFFFLDEIEHHFIKSRVPRRVRHAFRYLKRFCLVYPVVTRCECERAFEMIGIVYLAMGYRFHIHSNSQEFRVRPEQSFKSFGRRSFAVQFNAA